VTAGQSAPAAPTLLAATAGNGQVALSWTASSEATSYSVYRGTSAGAEGATPVATGITTPAYTDTGLVNGTTYFYTVAAVNTGGTSPMSNEASAKPVSAVAYASPVAYTATWSTPAPAAAAPDAITVTGAASATGLAIGTLSGNCGWLNTPTLTATSTPSNLVTSVNAAGYALLVPGTYTCNVPITGNAGVAATVAVTMTVNPAPFFAGAVNVGGTTMFLNPAAPGMLFGYFGYLNGNWLFHLDMGYEFILQANQFFTDPANGIFLYDYASGHAWYTSRTAPFPYIYDYNLGAVLFYDPLPQSGPTLGRYTNSPRSFYNFKTGLWISM
jgi:hypothetical protein